MTTTASGSLMTASPLRFNTGSPLYDASSHSRVYSNSGRLSTPAPIDGEKRLQVLARTRKEIALDKHIYLQASGEWKEATLTEQHDRMKNTLQHLRDRIEVLKNEEPSDASFNVLARRWKRMHNPTNLVCPVSDYVTLVLQDRLTEIESHLKCLNLLERRFFGDPNAQIGTPEYTGYVKRVYGWAYRSVWCLIARIWIHFTVSSTYQSQFRSLEHSLKQLHQKTVSRINSYYASQLISTVADKMNERVSAAALSNKDDDILDKLFFEEKIPDYQLLRLRLQTTQTINLRRGQSGQQMHRAITLYTRDLQQPTRFYIYSLGFVAQQVKKTAVDILPLILRSADPSVPDPAPSFVFSPVGGDVFTSQRYGRDEFLRELNKVFGAATQAEVIAAQDQIQAMLANPVQ